MSTKANIEYKRQTDAVAQVTGTRYCSNHNGYAPAQGGTWKGAGSGRRWCCASCSGAGRFHVKAVGAPV